MQGMRPMLAARLLRLRQRPDMQRLIAIFALAIAAHGAPSDAAANELSGVRKLARVVADAARPVHSADVAVTGISDGDTAKVELDGKPVRLRLARIDAPEHRQAWANRAEQSLRELVYKEQVHIEWCEVDRNGRPLVTMTIDGRDVSAEQVRRGMAWVYRAYSMDPGLLRLEASAREARLGLWDDPAPVPPWEWRRLKREGELVK